MTLLLDSDFILDSILTEEIPEEINDIEGCFEMQCNQIFLGMVTMQYQAQIEMVRLIGLFSIHSQPVILGRRKPSKLRVPNFCNTIKSYSFWLPSFILDSLQFSVERNYYLE